MRLFVTPVTKALAPSAGYGVERVPAGGAIVAANHFSALDPPLVGAFCPRAIHFLAKEELFALPVVGEVLRWTGAFSLRRDAGGHVAAIRHARELVRAGRVLGLFVDGRRQRFGYPDSFEPGAAMIAVREGVPVVPCGVDSFGWSLRNRRGCAVVWGEPLTLDSFAATRRGYREAARVIEVELVKLWRQAAEAVAAGLPAQLQDGTKRCGWLRPGAPAPGVSRRDPVPAAVDA
jgi:1-acyl-sn-glycerol-3-phosphate acyltransferase